MKSKKALEIIRTYHNQISLLCKGKLNSRIINAEKQIEQDLDRLEELYYENLSLHNKVAILESENLTFKKIIKEKSKLEKGNASLHTKIESVSSETEEQFKKFLDKENQKLKLKYEIEKNKQQPFSREEVVILSRNEKIAIDNKILSLEQENAKLKGIIKENFDYSEVGKYVYFKWKEEPVMEDEIKEVLGYDK